MNSYVDRALSYHLFTFCVLVAVLFTIVMPFHAHATTKLDAVKAAFIYNLTGYVSWPVHVKSNDASPVICVMGETNGVYSYLQQIAKKRAIEVLNKARDAKIEQCHILYISGYNNTDVNYVIGKTHDQPIVTISDAKGFVNRGGLVGLNLVDGQITFETSQSALDRSRLEFDSELLVLMMVNP